MCDHATISDEFAASPYRKVSPNDRTVNHLDGAQDRTKSVLFQRLLEGHVPLLIAPPVSLGYARARACYCSAENRGLPETPGRDEVEAQAVEGVQRVLRDWYFVEEDGGSLYL